MHQTQTGATATASFAAVSLSFERQNEMHLRSSHPVAKPFTRTVLPCALFPPLVRHWHDDRERRGFRFVQTRAPFPFRHALQANMFFFVFLAFSSTPPRPAARTSRTSSRPFAVRTGKPNSHAVTRTCSSFAASAHRISACCFVCADCVQGMLQLRPVVFLVSALLASSHSSLALLLQTQRPATSTCCSATSPVVIMT